MLMCEVPAVKFDSVNFRGNYKGAVRSLRRFLTEAGVMP